MRELVVISGKGGTGKTSVTASLAALAPKTLHLQPADGPQVTNQLLLVRPDRFIAARQGAVDFSGNELIDAAMQATGASSMKDMGKVMGQLKPKLQGRADMGAVSALIKARLG